MTPHLGAHLGLRFAPAPTAVDLLPYDRIGGVDGGECDAPFKFFTYPSEVDRFKARINTVAEAMDIGVRSCSALPPQERQAWDLFIAEWRDFAKQETSLWGSYGQWVQTCTHAATIDAWQAKLERWCTLPGPDEIQKPAAVNVVKWVAIAAVAVGVVTVLGIYAPEIKGALGRLRK